MHEDYTLDLDPEKRNDEEIRIESEGSFNGQALGVSP